jgi:F0F1-type ATP synthase membrane subunit b/b'
MPDTRILELEQQLSAANDTVAKLTLTNADLSRQLAEAEVRNKKMKRNSRNDESALKQQLTDAQNRRF